MIEVVRAAFSTPEFDACLTIRMDVFVSEQKVPLEEERDAYDITAIHFLARINAQPVGTARAIEKEPGLWKIGRVAVCASYRQQGVGLALMKAIESTCPARQFILNAQTSALPFYERQGYMAEGPIFYDAGLAHRVMRKDVGAS